MAAPGASARRAGHDFERDLARHLTEQLGIHVVTARSIPGTHAGTDLITITRHHPDGRPAATTPDVHGWHIEAKAHATSRLPTWMAQARRDADSSCLYAVATKIPYRPIGDCDIHIPRAAWTWWLTATSTDDHEPLRMSIDTFTQMINTDAR